MQDERFPAPDARIQILIGDAMQWLEQECRRQPPRSDAAQEVLRQLCWSAAAAAVGRAGDPRRSALYKRLQQARELADRLDRVLTERSGPGDRGLAPSARQDLEQLWLCYRSSAPLASALLDRLLLEAFLSSDLSAIRPSSKRARRHREDQGWRCLRIGASIGCGAGSLLLLLHSVSPPLLALPGLGDLGCALALSGLCGLAVSAMGRRRRLRQRLLEDVTATVSEVLRAGADSRALSETLRAVTPPGFTWSRQTIEALTRFRTRAIRRWVG